MPTTTIVIPCYNEAERLRPEAFLEFAWNHGDVTFQFVNDGSSDGTAERISNLARARPGQFNLLDRPANSGKGAAVRSGLLAALERGADFVGYWDADLSTPLSDILSFRQHLIEQPGVVMVLGSRIKMAGNTIRRRAHRHYTGRVFAAFVEALLHLNVYDTQCGAKLIRVTKGLRGVLEEPFLGKWTFDIELLLRLRKLYGASRSSRPGSTIYEYPLEMWEDRGPSKVIWFDVFPAVGEVIRLAVRDHGASSQAS